MKQNMLWKKFKKINKGENMFLNQLLSNEKEAFVSLSIHAAKANNVIEKEEIAMIEEYCKEMEIESFDLENAMEIDKILEIPDEICSNVPKLTITGFDELILENYKGILEYEEFFASISTYIGIVNINGFNLNLEKMTNDDIKITGKIENIDIERIEG